MRKKAKVEGLLHGREKTERWEGSRLQAAAEPPTQPTGGKARAH